MPREYSPYIVVETTFILSDPRYKTLPASAAKLFWALWARAFQDRRDTLPDWYDTGAMQEDSRLDARTVRRAAAILQQRCLIEYTEEGNIKVCGVREKGNIKWKENGVKSPPAPKQTKGEPLSKKRKEEKRKEYISEVWDSWSEAQIQDAALVPSGSDIQAIKTATASYTSEQIAGAIKKYGEILKGDEFKLVTRWTLAIFLDRHMGTFFPGSHPEDKYRFKGAGVSREDRIDKMMGRSKE